MLVPMHLVVLMRDQYANQNATVRTEFEKTAQFDIGKGERLWLHPDTVAIRHMRRENNEILFRQIEVRNRHRRNGDNESEMS